MAVNGGDYHDANSWAVVALAQWRFWDWGRSFKGVQSKRTEVAKSRNALIQLEDSIELDIKRSYLALQATEKNIFVAEKAVEQAKENFRMAEERYREQVATSTEVTDAETLLTSSRVDYYAALYQFNLARATLERAMGIDNF
jgi:outer membrane protein TolC